MGQEDGMSKKRDESEGIWVVLKMDGTYGIIGRVSGYKKLDESTRNQILTTKGALQLDVAFDYAEMFRPMPVMDPRTGEPIMTPQGAPRMAMGREPLVTNVGFMFNHETVTFVRDWKRLNFFDDMHGADKERYIGFRDAAIKGSIDRRAEEAGILAPGNNNGVESALHPRQRQG